MRVGRTHLLKVDRARVWLTTESPGHRQLEVHLWSGPELVRLIFADHQEAKAFVDELIERVSMWDAEKGPLVLPSPNRP